MQEITQSYRRSETPSPEIWDRQRKLHALVFTAVFSRYCYVYLTFAQTTVAVIAGCEAAWAFFCGMFKVVIPENVARHIFRVMCPARLCDRQKVSPARAGVLFSWRPHNGSE
jgi:transposase